jgi:hypothetical protein
MDTPNEIKELHKRLEAKRHLEAIRDFQRKKYEDFFEYWDVIDYTGKHLALSMYMLVEALIARELYQVSQEENEDHGERERHEKRKECCCNGKSQCHKDEREEVTQ